MNEPSRDFAKPPVNPCETSLLFDFQGAGFFAACFASFKALSGGVSHVILKITCRHNIIKLEKLQGVPARNSKWLLPPPSAVNTGSEMLRYSFRLIILGLCAWYVWVFPCCLIAWGKPILLFLSRWGQSGTGLQAPVSKFCFSCRQLLLKFGFYLINEEITFA